MTILLQVSAHLVALEVLDRTKNFADAAGELGISKAALSVRMSRLEELLGVALLEQSTDDRRNKAVTSAGRSLARSVRDARTLIENELVAVGAIRKRDPGQSRRAAA